MVTQIDFQAPTAKGYGGGLVVSINAFYSNDTSSNPACFLDFIVRKKQE